jgi:D-alanyl-D-alanine carboxypeptidase/D-alanyl-D-alanine-endopeptidase (penicillin-binding protein 4)
MVPASTLKLLTALAAFDRWGPDHRFRTDFFLDGDGWLLVKGYGDPFLVSEEIDLVAGALKAHGVTRVAGIATDSSYFAPDVEVAGRSGSDNPYDAPVAPLAANFNTLYVRVVHGRVASAEPQTPLTPLALSLSRRLGEGRQRINLGRRDLAPRYFAELLAAKLREIGVEVDDGWREAEVPAGVEPVYRHYNSRDLRALVTAMLEYSNNFIANHLFLELGDDGTGRPLTMAAAREAMSAWVDRTFGWEDYRIEEGAGLSRGNRLSARQLVEVVKVFAPYRDLLPAQSDRVLAKSGTLRGVSCYAGFVLRDGQWAPFALMVNQPVAYSLREEVAEQLAVERDLAHYCDSKGC